MRRLSFCALLFCGLMTAACTDRSNASANKAETDDNGLPAPARSAGGVTGMPNEPGPGSSKPVTGEPPPEPAIAGDTAALSNPETGVLPGAGTEADQTPAGLKGMAEPTPEDAIAVIRDYYQSVNSRSYARAYSLWSDNGRSSGQSPEQFAAGFADTASVIAEIQMPGAVDAAAGSRYIEIPVAISATRSDGSVRKYVGVYVLRRAVVDGATAEQRAWRIGSADLREVRQ